MAPATAGGGGPSVIASASDASCAPKESDMKRLSRFAILLPIFLAACASGSGQGDVPTQPVLAAAEVPKVKAGILTMRDKTLDELYAQKPETREEVKKAIGYAVFDSSQINVVLFVGHRGTGVLGE